MLVLGVFLYILWGGSPSHAITQQITVEKVSGKEATYRATDNLIPLSGSQTWHYVVIIPSGTCNAAAFSNAAGTISYIEDNDVKVSVVAGTATICFRSSTPVLVGDPTVLYGGIDVGDNVGPRVGNVITYRPNARVFNSDNIGDNLVIRVEFDDKVDVDYNGGLGPRLKTNVGTNRYAYVEDGTVLRPRGIWTFHLILQAGDNAADLDVLGWENNGATVEDEAGNPFLPATADSYFPGHLAANHAVTVDTSPPVITVGSVRGNQVSATATDNLDSSVAFFKRRLVDTSSSLSQNACDSTNTDSFSDYTANTDISLTPVGYSACFHAKDAAGNSAYALSTAALAPPTVSVNPSSDDSTPKRSITVRASSSSPGIVVSSWRNKNIAGLAACDAAALASFFESGAQKTLDNEAYNGNRVCFGVRDTNHNWGYGVSGLITNIDRTPPAITAAPAGASSNVKLEITVSASSTSFDIDENSWRHKVIPAAAGCNGASMSSSTSPGLEVTINSEAHNNHKVCFTARDTAGNRSYRSSGVISGIDRTAPAIAVSSVVSNQVSATVSDVNDNSPTFRSKIISDNTCDSTVSGFISYVSGTALTLTAGSRACFYASDFLSNTRYVASGPGVDTTNSEMVVQSDTTPPTITVSPSAADSSPKRAITVSASSSDSDADSSSWKYKIVSASANCNAAAVSSGTSSGRAATLNSQSHNNRKVCFAVKDTSNNWNYAASGVITGIDRTSPTISVGNVVNKRVRATVSDNSDNSPTLESQIIGGNICSSLTVGSFSPYTSGTDLTLPVGSRACFKATDSAGNAAYEASSAASEINLPTINVGTVRNNRVSATITGDLSNSPTFEVQIITDSVCGPGTSGSFDSYTSGTSLSLPVGSRACFRITDNIGRQAYVASAAGTQPGGNNNQPRRTTPRQTPPPRQKKSLAVSVTGGDALTATDNYGSGTTMSYMVRSDDACDDTTKGTFNVYQEGTALAPADVDYDHYVCFKSVDNNDPTSVAYAVSPLVVVDQPDPDQPPGSAASETDANAPPPTPDPGDSGVGTKPDPDQPPGSAASETDTSSRQPQPPGSTASGSEATDSAGSETDTDTPPPTPDPGDDDSSPLPALIVIGLIVVLTLAVAKRAFRKT